MTTKVSTPAKTFKIGGDLEVNRLGFGAMRITGKGIWGEPQSAEEPKRVLKRALELGVNFIDSLFYPAMILLDSPRPAKRYR
jgi:predicted aldo/keto reductase-like oxidoreductase